MITRPDPEQRRILRMFRQKRKNTNAQLTAGAEAPTPNAKLSHLRSALCEAIKAEAVLRNHPHLVGNGISPEEATATADIVKFCRNHFRRALIQSAGERYNFLCEIAHWNRELGRDIKTAMSATLRAFQEAHRHLAEKDRDYVGEFYANGTNPVPPPLRTAVKIYAEYKATAEDIHAFLESARTAITNWLRDVLLVFPEHATAS